MYPHQRFQFLFGISLALFITLWTPVVVVEAVSPSSTTTTWQILQHAFHKYGVSPYPDFVPGHSAAPAPAQPAAQEHAVHPSQHAAAAAAAEQASMQCSAQGTCSAAVAAQQALQGGQLPPDATATDPQQQPHHQDSQQQQDGQQHQQDALPVLGLIPQHHQAAEAVPAHGIAATIHQPPPAGTAAAPGDAHALVQSHAPAPAPAAAPARPHRPPPVRRLLNLAELQDGASVLAANAEARRPERAIDRDIDSFMKNDCDAEKWMMIELSQLGTVETVKLTMKELYSSRVHTFRVLGRTSHPRKDGPDLTASLTSGAWQLLGSFTAENKRGTQSFSLPQRSRVRYLLLMFDTHYGNEQMCAMNWIEVLGVSAAQELEEALALQEMEAEHEEHGQPVPQHDQQHIQQQQQQQLARHVPEHQQVVPVHHPHHSQHHHQHYHQQYLEQQLRALPEAQHIPSPQAEQSQPDGQAHSVPAGQARLQQVASKEFSVQVAAEGSDGVALAGDAAAGATGGSADHAAAQQQGQQQTAGDLSNANGAAAAGSSSQPQQDSSVQAGAVPAPSSVQQGVGSNGAVPVPAASNAPQQQEMQQQAAGATGAGSATAGQAAPAAGTQAGAAQEAAGSTGQVASEGTTPASVPQQPTGEQQQQQQHEAPGAATGAQQQEQQRQQQGQAGTTGPDKPGSPAPAAAEVLAAPVTGAGQEAASAGHTGPAVVRPNGSAPAPAPVQAHPPQQQHQQHPAPAGSINGNGNGNGHHPTPQQQQQAQSGPTNGGGIAQQARDTGSVLDSRGSNKPKQAGNLFDVVKSEMMQLKLDQGKLTKKVDALTKRSSDFEATAAALQQQQAALSSQLDRLSKKLDALIGTQAAANAAQQQLRKDVSTLLAAHKEQRGYAARRSVATPGGARCGVMQDEDMPDVHVTAEPGSSLDTPRRPMMPPVCARPPPEEPPLLLQSKYQWSVVTALASTSLLGLWLVLHPKSWGFPHVLRLVVCVLALLNGILAVLLGLWLLVMQGLAAQQQRVLLFMDPHMSMPVHRMLSNGSTWG